MRDLLYVRAPLHFAIEARIYWLCSLAGAAIWDSELEKLNAVVAIGGMGDVACRAFDLTAAVLMSRLILVQRRSG